MREIAFDHACDELFGVGDLVNRGPHGVEAIKWLEERFTAVVTGNHEPPLQSWFGAKLLQGRPRSPPSPFDPDVNAACTVTELRIRESEGEMRPGGKGP